MFFHWQNLNEKPLGQHGWGLRKGRCWWNFGDHNSIGLEWVIPDTKCGFSFEVGAGDSDQGWHFSIHLPLLFSFYLGLDFRLWAPLDHSFERDGKTYWLHQHREFAFSIYDWSIRLTPWGRSGEWRRDDPWYVRGVHLDVKDFLLGRTKYTSEVVKAPFGITIPMIEGPYEATATLERFTWKRPRWRARTRLIWKAEMSRPGNGIPFPGKGENSWDCGMDGLFGWSAESRNGEDIEKLIAHGVESVLNSRRRYAGSVGWIPEISSAPN